MIDFSKPIKIVDWQYPSHVIAELAPDVGLRLMAASARWGTEHTTAQVRTLHPASIEFLTKHVGISAIYEVELTKTKPVLFKQ